MSLVREFHTSAATLCNIQSGTSSDLPYFSWWELVFGQIMNCNFHIKKSTEKSRKPQTKVISGYHIWNSWFKWMLNFLCLSPLCNRRYYRVILRNPCFCSELLFAQRIEESRLGSVSVIDLFSERIYVTLRRSLLMAKKNTFRFQLKKYALDGASSCCSAKKTF